MYGVAYLLSLAGRRDGGANSHLGSVTGVPCPASASSGMGSRSIASVSTRRRPCARRCSVTWAPFDSSNCARSAAFLIAQLMTQLVDVEATTELPIRRAGNVSSLLEVGLEAHSELGTPLLVRAGIADLAQLVLEVFDAGHLGDLHYDGGCWTIDSQGHSADDVNSSLNFPGSRGVQRACAPARGGPGRRGPHGSGRARPPLV